MRENITPPRASVRNSTPAEGGWNPTSFSVRGLYFSAKVFPPGPEWLAISRATGHATTNASMTMRNQALMIAGRFRLKRRHAFWFGLRCTGAAAFPDSGCASVIFHPSIQDDIGEIHEEIQHHPHEGVENNQANHHR